MATFVFYTHLIAHQRDSQSEKKKTLFIIFITLYSSVQILFAYFPSVPRTCFNTFCNAGLLVMNCLRFCLSKKINTLPSLKKYFCWLYKCHRIKQHAFLVTVSQFCHSILLGSVRLFPLWVSPVLTRGPRLTEAIGRFLTHMPGGRCCCEQRSQLSCGQDMHMGYFHVAWPSSQCWSKLRNHRNHLPSTITADSHNGPARNCQDDILRWKVLFWFSAKYFLPSIPYIII